MTIETIRLAQRVGVETMPVDQATRLLRTYHYLHRGRTMAQVAYGIILDQAQVGCALFAYPFGVNHGLPEYKPFEVVELARFWLAQNVPHLASCAIGKMLRRVASDWGRKYPDMPPVRAILSYADTEYHEGTIYKAVGMEDMGLSSHPHQPGNRPAHEDYMHPKRRFVKRLRS